ncbi:MAG: trimeric autotransporter adhesin [Phycisphaerales bacterium]|nr:trimeric autotransporter adhesin [Phycisphaerales bacterium]
MVAVSLIPRAVFAAPIVPAYSSFAGTNTKLYLDFDGDNTPTYGTYTPGVTPGYSIDADTDNFSAAELTNIEKIWQSVAEKYSPFNVNVTTVDPGNQNNYETMRIVIGGSGAWLGQEAGGVAALTAYMNPSFPNVAFVFPGHLANGNPKYVAESAAHEAGHAFGLKHQSLYDADKNKLQEYNPGDASKAPIMGIPYASQRAIWWRGSGPDGATLIQDDLNSLSLFGTARPNFGYRADDHASTLAAVADPLSMDLDFNLAGYGIVERITDADFFSFITPGGHANIVADVAPFGAMLDLSMSLYDAAGNLLTTSATSSLGERISYALDAGTYKLAITSAGNYGDVGQYFISGSAVPEPSSAAVVLLLFSPLFCRRRVR